MKLSTLKRATWILTYLALNPFAWAQATDIFKSQVAIEGLAASQQNEAAATFSVLSSAEMRDLYGSGLADRFIGMQLVVRNIGSSYLFVGDVQASITLPKQEAITSSVADRQVIELVLQKDLPKNRNRWRALAQVGTTIATILTDVLDAGSSSVAAAAIGGMSAQRAIETVIPDRSLDALMHMCETIFRPGLVSPHSAVPGTVFLPLDLLLDKAEQRLYKKDPHAVLPDLYKRVHLRVTVYQATVDQMKK